MIRQLKNLYHLAMAVLATIFYRFPAKKLFVIGVTGTDGKTTTVHLINHLLLTAGEKSVMLSTVCAPGFHVTTPSSWQLQKFLAQALKSGKKFAVLEVTSHGLDQHRLWGSNFQIGVITNVTREHLDYHQTWENYLATKARLLAKVKWAVLNRDDQSYQPLLARLINQSATKIITYGIEKKADFTPKGFPFQTKLPGQYNLYNCLAAISVAKIISLPEKKIRTGLLSFSAVKGRMEPVNVGQPFKVVVDFAHTPNAFAQVLPTARAMTKGKLIHVFGCTGQRDRRKRPLMGQISGRFSDKIFLTHEDTYGEDLNQIISEIEPGVKKAGKRLGKDYWLIKDRKTAIEKAMVMAHKDDLVLITGVGHQRSLNLGGREVSWSDQSVVRKIWRKIQ